MLTASPTLAIAERRDVDRVRNQVDAEAAAVDFVDREADAVDRDRALRRDVARKLGGQLERPALRARVGLDRDDVPRPSTWPATRWPPRRSARRSAFSRLTRAPAPSAPSVVRESVSFGDVDGECVAVERDRGEADAGDGDAVADRDVIETERAGVDDEAHVAAARLDARDAAGGFNDAGEHASVSRQESQPEIRAAGRLFNQRHRSRRRASDGEAGKAASRSAARYRRAAIGAM